MQERQRRNRVVSIDGISSSDLYNIAYKQIGVYIHFRLYYFVRHLPQLILFLDCVLYPAAYQLVFWQIEVRYLHIIHVMYAHRIGAHLSRPRVKYD